MFYLHPWDMDTGQPRGTVSAFTRFRHYFNAARCAERLNALLDNHRFAPVNQVLAGLGSGLPLHSYGEAKHQTPTEAA
jgi:hypothetical protein